MSGRPPVPPRPLYESARAGNGLGPPPPPPLPPLPQSIRAQNEVYSTPSRYEVEESPPRFEHPMIAPRPHRVDRSIPTNITRILDDQLQAPPLPAPPPSSLTASLPSLALLQTALNKIVNPAHDPSLRIAWCRDVFFLIERTNPTGYPYTDPPIGPITFSSSDGPILKTLADTAVPLVLQIAASFPVPPSNTAATPKIPPYIAEAIALRAFLQATGAFPSFIPHNPRAAFRDYESAARNGFATAWFRLGRDYENFNDHQHARDCFERGVRLGVESCLYRMGMAHLLGQLSLPPNPSLALPLLHRAALLASLTCPQPAYVYALLLLSDFTLPSLPASLLHPTIFAPFIPPNSSPHLEARKHLERAAHLHFSPAQYKLGHAYEFAEPPFPFNPILSVQYYSLASQQGEAEADMALSKWFLCGSGGAASFSNTNPIGGFDKDEPLALHFASKAASKNLPSALFAMGYYAEVGLGQPKDIDNAREWYTRAVQAGNEDASERLSALEAFVHSHSHASSAQSGAISREEHERLTQSRLVRRRTMAMQSMANQPISPPWDGKVFPTILQDQHAYTQGDGRSIIDGIRKNSMRETAPPHEQQQQQQQQQPPPPPPRGRSQSPRALPPQPVPVPVPVKQPPPPPRYPWGDTVAPGIGPLSAPLSSTSSPNHSRTASPAGRPFPSHRTDSPVPGRKAKTPPPPVGGRENGGMRSESPAPGLGRINNNNRLGRLERMRLNLNDDKGVVPNTPTANTNNGALPPPTTTAASTAKPLTPNRHGAAQTFAEMGVHGVKAEEKDCVIM